MLRIREGNHAARIFAIVSIAAVLEPWAVAANTPESFDDFGTLKRHHTRVAFDATADYLRRRPEAADATAAYRFLFETALAEGLSREARPFAEEFLTDRSDAAPAEKSLARRVAMVGLAAEGEAEAAIELLGEELSAVRRADPSSAIESATTLAAAVQRGGKPDAAKQVYERLRRGFFLNPGVDAVVENRLARLERLGKPLPAIGLKDLEGKPVTAGDLAGKVVLVDFWATNCPPCLEELPELKRLHADQNEAGLEVLAVSLDEEEETVREFLGRSPVPWRVFVSAADADTTREAFGVETIPANFLVDRGGMVARVDLHGADLRAEVERLLREDQEK